MIIVKIKESSKGHRLQIKNQNGKIFNDFYSSPGNAKKAFIEFTRQIKEGNWKIE